MKLKKRPLQYETVTSLTELTKLLETTSQVHSQQFKNPFVLPKSNKHNKSAYDFTGQKESCISKGNYYFSTRTEKITIPCKECNFP